VGPLVHDLAVENIGDIAAVTNTFETIPFAGRIFDILLAAEALFVLPVGIAGIPVDAATIEVSRFALGLVIVSITLVRPDPQGGLVLALDENEITCAPLDHLALDGFHPDAAGGAILADAMKQDATVHGPVFPRRPGFLAPLELHHQVIILVLL